MKFWKVVLYDEIKNLEFSPNDDRREFPIFEFGKHHVDLLLRNIYDRKINILQKFGYFQPEIITICPTQFLILEEAFKSGEYIIDNVGQVSSESMYLFGVEIAPAIFGVVLKRSEYKKFVGQEDLDLKDINKVIDYGF